MAQLKDKQIHVLLFEDESEKQKNICQRIETIYENIQGSEDFQHSVLPYGSGVTDAEKALNQLPNNLVIQIWDLVFENTVNDNHNDDPVFSDFLSALKNANSEEFLAGIIQQMYKRPHWRLILLATVGPTQDSLIEAIKKYNNSVREETRKIQVFLRTELHRFEQQLADEMTFLMNMALTSTIQQP